MSKPTQSDLLSRVRLLLLREFPILLLLLAVCFLIQWRAINYVSGAPLSADRGVFASVGWAMTDGARNYRDVWDHKPPGIHLLTSWALTLSGDEPGRVIWRVQWWNSVALTFLAGLAARVLLGSVIGALLAALMVSALMYHQSLYIGGHFTGEYGATVVTAGMLVGGLGIWGLRGGWLRADSSRILGLVGACGFVMAVATLFKEPFLLDSFALLGWLGFWLVRDRRDGRGALRVVGAFVAGALIPYILVALYFILRGGLGDWLATYLYNFAYTGEHAHLTAAEGSRLARSSLLFRNFLVQPSIPFACFAALGLVGALVPSYIRRTAGASVAVVAWLLCAFLGASLGGGLFSHYYMQCVVPFVLLGISGLGLLIHLTQRLPALIPHLARAGAPLILSLVLLMIYGEVPGITVTPGQSDTAIYHALRRHQYHLVRRPQEEADKYILANSTATDAIWAQCFKNTGIYAEVRRRPATKHLFVQDFLFINTLGSTRADKLKILSDQLRQNQPKFLILEDKDPASIPYLKDADLVTWIQQNYQPTPHRRLGAVVWQRRAP